MLLEAVAGLLTAEEQPLAAITCRSLAAAIRSVVTKLKLQAAQDLHDFAAALGAGHYSNLSVLHVEPSASVPFQLPAFLSSLPRQLPRLQELKLTTGPTAGTQQYSSLARTLGCLTSLTRLSIHVPDERTGPLLLLPYLSSLNNLQDLCLGGALATHSLPTGLKILRLANAAGTSLSHVDSCLQLRDLQLHDAELPEGWGQSQNFWGALTPLTALTALQGFLCCSDLLDGACWTEVGSGARQRLPVVQCLKRLCLGKTGTMLSNTTASGCIRGIGALSMLTNLEMLWLDNSTDSLGGPLPAGLQHLRLGGVADLRCCTSLCSLTLEVKENGMRVGWLPESLQELAVIHHEDHWRGLGLRNFARLPSLQRFSCWAPAHCFKSHGKLKQIMRFGPKLEVVHLYVVPEAFVYGYGADEVAPDCFEACDKAADRPVVHVPQLAQGARTGLRGYWRVDFTLEDVTAVAS